VICPGTSRDKEIFLSRDKGTEGQGNIFVPGQRDNVTSCHSLSQEVPRDATRHPVETQVGTSGRSIVSNVCYKKQHTLG
jgi:hypothetical protein